jgi:hypothetical protein
MAKLVDSLSNLGGRPSVKSAKSTLVLIVSVFMASVFLFHSSLFDKSHHHNHKLHHSPLHAKEILDKCKANNVVPGPPKDFRARTVSDRYEAGTVPIVIRNATIWIGRGEGIHTKGDILLEKQVSQLKEMYELLTQMTEE